MGRNKNERRLILDTFRNGKYLILDEINLTSKSVL